MGRMLRKAISNLLRQRLLTGVVLFLAGVTLTGLPTLLYGPPLPAIHDEFAYLLEGETFAKGRLVNPPPGPPKLFETFHELLTPHYVGKFPPAQGVALAVGIWLGNPIIGIWIVNGLWAVALFWMLRAVAGPGWAFGGALAGMVGYGAMSYWGQSFWGGSVLALGGTLALGGALRIWRKRGRALPAAAWAGVGCGIMALARPMDGLIFAVLPSGLIFWKTLPEGRAGWKKLAAFLVPAFCGVALMLGYNKATTGNPLLFAHRLYDSTRVPGLVLFVWQKPGADPPDLPLYLVRYEKTFDRDLGATDFNWHLYGQNLGKYLYWQTRFLLPWWIVPVLLLGIIGVFAARDGPARVALLSLVFLAIPFLILRFYGFSHYLAAWTAPVLVLCVRGGRRWLAWRPKGLAWVGWVAVAGFALWPGVIAYEQLTQGFPDWAAYPWSLPRLNVERTVLENSEKTGRKQLVAVVYPEDHDSHAEWVFNSPEPREQQVIWVHAPSPEKMSELYQLFPDYDEWLAFTTAGGRLDHLDRVKIPPDSPAATTSPARK